MSRLWGLLGLLGLLGAACFSDGSVPVSEPAGPPEIRAEVVERHAREFRTDLADRDPGSQGEAAAATYILGHLQQAGYLVRLDGVPVEDLVRSTNLVAIPPRADDPEVVVAVGYGTDGGRGRGDLTLGLFLELARALRAAEPDHSVELVALAGEAAGQEAEGVGSRRLATTLADADLDPLVLTFTVVAGPGVFLALGPGGTPADLVGIASQHGLRASSGRLQESIFSRAGLDHLEIWGPVEGTGEVLLQYLQDYSR